MLYIYSLSEDATDEIQGDLSLTTRSTTGAFRANIEMGFCFRSFAKRIVNATTIWDCMQVRTSVDPKSNDLETYSTEFDLVDLYWSSAKVPTAIPIFTKDSDNIFKDNQSKNWKHVPNKSFKTGCSVANVNSSGTTYRCKELNVHFVRNWITDAPTYQDIKLTAESRDLTYDVFGWISSYIDADYSGVPYDPKIS